MGALPSLVVGVVSSCVYSSITFMAMLPEDVVVLALLNVVEVWNSEAENLNLKQPV